MSLVGSFGLLQELSSIRIAEGQGSGRQLEGWDLDFEEERRRKQAEWSDR